jgi:hypothetical protein
MSEAGHGKSCTLTQSADRPDTPDPTMATLMSAVSAAAVGVRCG